MMRLFSRIKQYISSFSQPEDLVLLPSTKPDPAPVMPPKSYGTRGWLEIPELHIGVPLYDSMDKNKQEIVDDENSAIYMNWGTQQCIADHTYQNNFVNLSKAVVGKTIAIIDDGKDQRRYRCYSSQIGHIRIGPNGGNTLLDENWELVYPQNIGGISIYTCLQLSADDVMDVRLTFWKRIYNEEGG